MLLSEFLKDQKNSQYMKTRDAGFVEADHPRGQPDNPGQFVAGGGSTSEQKSIKTKASNNFEETKRDGDGKLIRADGKALPNHIAKLKIPPAWKNVIYNPDEKANMLLVGQDAAGRRQVLYSDKFKNKNAQAKFKRIQELDKKFDLIVKQNDASLKENKEEALITKLIMQTGIRPGGEEETRAKVKAYGATTLEGRHIIANKEGVTLSFIGKKGVQNNIPVEDKQLVKFLQERSKDKDQRIFQTDGGSLLKYVHSLDGGKFKTKDFRTLLGTKTAIGLIEKEKPPKNEKEYKIKVKEVAKQVAMKLGNTPTVCLQAYINPSVFSEWRIKI